jgi:hypothetical protein
MSIELLKEAIRKSKLEMTEKEGALKRLVKMVK